jgi:hypothetical protein
MQKAGILRCFTIAAATSSWVLKGFDAQTTTSAPPAFRVFMRFPVSDVTWRQQAILTPFKGFFFANLCAIWPRTGILLPAQSIFSSPASASFMSFTS